MATSGWSNRITVVIGSMDGPAITTNTIPDGEEGQAYSASLAATGATPITWNIVGGEPPGIVINPTTGALSGIPTLQGAYNMVVRASNSYGFFDKSYAIDIDPADTTPPADLRPTVTTGVLPAAQQGASYSQTVTFGYTGVGSITSRSADGLPDGLSMNPGTGAITGVPTMYGSYEVIFYATASPEGKGPERKITLVVNPIPDATITSAWAEDAQTRRR